MWSEGSGKCHFQPVGVIAPELGIAATCPKGFPDRNIQTVLSEGLFTQGLCGPYMAEFPTYNSQQILIKPMRKKRVGRKVF